MFKTNDSKNYSKIIAFLEIDRFISSNINDDNVLKLRL